MSDYSEAELIARARNVAEAAGVPTIVFGVRRHNDTVFATCEGHEVDASTFADALDGVKESLKREAQREASKARHALDRADRLAGL